MTDNTDKINITCSKCGAVNRVDRARTGSAICGRCKAALQAQATPVVVTDRNFADEVERSPLPVLVDFWAAWCGPCRMVAPVMEQLARELAGRVKIAKLDVDANQMTAARFRVQSIPSMIIFRNGQEVDRIVGAQGREAILARLRPYLSS